MQFAQIATKHIEKKRNMQTKNNASAIVDNCEIMVRSPETFVDEMNEVVVQWMYTIAKNKY